jgi:tetratricopeptide (TPR) repeat protein
LSRSFRAGPGLWLALLVLGVRPVAGQTLPIKAPPAEAEPGACPPVALPSPGPTAFPAAVDSLLTSGSRAAILGDHTAAEELLRRAAALDPANPVVSYRLARTLDDHGSREEAALEYCRYLALAPSAVDAEAIRERARTLLAGAAPPAPERWKLEALSGIEAFHAGRYDDAAAAFTRVVELRPDLADGFYNRGVANLAAGRVQHASADLETYLRMSPAAKDASRVRERLDGLAARSRVRPQEEERAAPAQAARTFAPGRVLVQGLVVPGLGQHATGRTVWGVGVLAAVGGAVYVGTRSESVVRRQEARDPFGNRYEYDVRVLERPHQAIGIGAAVAIGVAAALESYLYARGRAEPAAVVASGWAKPVALRKLTVVPFVDGVRLGLSVSVDRRVPPDRVGSPPWAPRGSGRDAIQLPVR